MKKILVAGGAGFLGSHLCDRLIQEGNQVVCIDNLITGNLRNISHLLNHENFRFMEHDIENPLTIDVDQIYNLACPASPTHYQQDPVRTVKTCVLGAINLLDLAKKKNARILQASTSEVYGNPMVNPQDEQYLGNVNCIGIRACYDEGKRIAETLFFDYYRKYKVSIKVMRIFNVYGPRMNIDDGRVVSNFIVQALTGKDITIYGDGLQTRSFCYADELIDGMIMFMNSESQFIGPVNMGNPEEVTVLQLAEKILYKTGSRSTVVHVGLPQDDPVKRKPDIAVAKKKLGWEPVMGLDEGLINTIDYFKKLLDAEGIVKNTEK